MAKKRKKHLDLPGSRSALHLLGPAQGPQGAANEVQDLRIWRTKMAQNDYR